MAGLHQPFAPGRLWSLWDMLNGYAYLFVHVMDQIDEICSIAQADPTGTWKKNKATGSLAGMVFGTFLDTVRYLAKETDMRSVADQVSRIQKWTEMLDLPLARIAPECIQLRVRIEEELQQSPMTASLYLASG